MSVLTACNFCFLKTINYTEVQKYLFGIIGLTMYHVYKAKLILTSGCPPRKSLRTWRRRPTVRSLWRPTTTTATARRSLRRTSRRRERRLLTKKATAKDDKGVQDKDVRVESTEAQSFVNFDKALTTLWTGAKRNIFFVGGRNFPSGQNEIGQCMF